MSRRPIKPCPHCGGVAYLNSNYSYKTRSYFIFVKCDICGATGKTTCEQEDPAISEWQSDACERAIEAWNMRTGEKGATDEAQN